MQGFIEEPDHDALIDDLDHIEGDRAVGLAEGFITGTQAEQLKAWTYLVESGKAWELQGWFAERAIELLADCKITVRRELLPQSVRDEVDRQQASAAT